MFDVLMHECAKHASEYRQEQAGITWGQQREKSSQVLPLDSGNLEVSGNTSSQKKMMTYSTGPLIRNTYFKQGLKPYCPRGCKRNFLIHRFLLLAKNIAPISYFPRSRFQLSSFLSLLTAVIGFFFSIIMWSLPFSRRIFVASTTAPMSPRL